MLHFSSFQRTLLAPSWVMAAALACASGAVQALSLGQLTVASGLGQPLRAALEITDYQVQELRQLKVQLASPASFEQAGLPFHPALQGLQVQLEFRGNGQAFIALIGQSPVNDNFIDVIVEAQWPAGRLALNYTLLVAPTTAPSKAQIVGTGASPKGDAASSAWLSPVVSTAASGTAAKETANQMANRTNTEASTALAPASGQAITVQAGDSASKLVLRAMPPGVSLDQMLLAMVRANPEAFMEGNVNLLREGAQIQMPDAQEAAQISAEEARQTVSAQTADFAAYVRRLAQSPLPAPEAASREMTAKLESPAPPLPAPASGQDKLTLSKRDIGTDQAEVRLAVEREIQDKTEQLAALKKNLESLQSLSADNAAAAAPLATPPSPLQPSLPTAVAEVAQDLAPPSWLAQLARNPSMGAWVLSLLAGMAACVWLVRRRLGPAADLFADQRQAAQSAAQSTARSAAPPGGGNQAPGTPFLASGLPPQFAGLDLNLNSPPTPPSPPSPPTGERPSQAPGPSA